ncbi:MAG TPA: DUF6093 family protein [Jiangellaceae bacterium]|nr:DUF6093 family protein [Jiangellaceae bacterium]
MGMPSLMRRGRRFIERQMLDTIRLERLDPEQRDPLTGEALRTTYYEGKGKIQSFRPFETAQEVAGVTFVQGRREVHVPYDVGPVRVGDVATVVAAPEQPLLVGKEYRVAFPDYKTSQTAQRILVDQD